MRTIFVLFVLLTMPGAACQDVKDTAKGAGKAVVDCTKAELAPTVRELGPVMERVVLDALDPSGKVDWAPVKDVAKGLASDVGRCVLAETIAAFLTRKPDPNAPQSAGVEVNRIELADGFASLRAELWGGARFKTTAGEL